MKVKFYCYADESDVYEFEDDTTEEELIDFSCEWASDNVSSSFEIIEDEEFS